MSSEKQIEEMARAMCRNYKGNGVCNADESLCYLECVYGYCAERAYCAGYRKQSEGEWNENIIGFCNVCMSCGVIVERTAIKNNSGKLNFCPNCGAKMKGGEG